MARFDVFRFRGTGVRYVVDVQASLFDEAETRVVVPLIPKERLTAPLITRLNPIIEIDNTPLVFSALEVASQPKRRLGPFVTNVEADHRDEIVAALDFLFQGF